MPRKKSLDIGCLNIVSQPHTPEQYLELFDKAEQMPSAKIAEHQYCRIRQLRAIDKNDRMKGIKGKIFKHLQIGPDDEWLNSETDRPAEQHEVADAMPDHLMPGLVQFDFVFYPNGHRLFFTMKNEKGKPLAPRTAERIFQAVFKKVEVEWQEPIEINVHVETSHEGLEKLFSMPHVKSIEYEVALPNPDEGNGAQDKFKKRLEKQNVKKQHTKLQAAKDRSIDPDDETKTELKVAASNGFVRAVGKKEDGEKDEVSTKDHPFTSREVVDPATRPLIDILVSKAPQYLGKILSRFG